MSLGNYKNDDDDDDDDDDGDDDDGGDDDDNGDCHDKEEGDMLGENVEDELDVMYTKTYEYFLGMLIRKKN